MKSRCNYEKNDSFNDYGKKGISVCNEWEDDFQIFYDWAMANGYKDELSIDRIDNDGNYEFKYIAQVNCFVVAHDPDNQYNAVIQDNIIPE